MRPDSMGIARGAAAERPCQSLRRSTIPQFPGTQENGDSAFVLQAGPHAHARIRPVHRDVPAAMLESFLQHHLKPCRPPANPVACAM